MSKPRTYNIRFAAIEMISKLIAERPKFKEDVQEFAFNFLVDVRVNAEKKLAIAFTDIWAIWPPENKEVARFRTACMFEFPDFETVFTLSSEKRYDIPLDLEILLKSTGLTTTRGMIHTELRGTYLSGAVLPLVDMAKIIKDQAKAKKEANSSSSPSEP